MTSLLSGGGTGLVPLHLKDSPSFNRTEFVFYIKKICCEDVVASFNANKASITYKVFGINTKN